MFVWHVIMDNREVIDKVFSSDAIVMNLQALNKHAAIRELVIALENAQRLHDRDAALEAIMAREERMSTGMQNGIAIPHGKTKTQDGVVAALGISKQGIDFDCLDGLPAHIVVLMVSSPSKNSLHIEFLAAISRLLNRQAIRDAILASDTPNDVLTVLMDG